MLAESLDYQLRQNERLGQKRQREAIELRHENWLSLNNQSLLNFTHNDYLCLAAHPQVKRAAIQAIEKYGIGSSASAVVSGYYTPHCELEEHFADFLQRDRAILFNSGYLANLGVLSTLANRQSVVLSDKLCHASLLDGIQLSRAKHYRYKHNDVLHAGSLLSQYPTTLLVTEGVFSMEGDLCPANKLAALATAQHNADNR